MSGKELNIRNIYGKSRIKSLDDAKKQILDKYDGTNAVTLIDWLESVRNRPSSMQRVWKLANQFAQLHEVITWELSNTTKEELKTLISHINNNRGWSITTQADYRRLIKQFFLWFEDEDPRIDSFSPEAVRFYKAVRKINITPEKRERDPSTIITDEDADKIITKGCHTPKAKAFIAVLHESGFRATEILGIRRQDIVFNHNGSYSVTVNGKTGVRTVTMIKSMGYLQTWLKNHPDESPSAYVWLAQSQMYQGKPLKYGGATKLVREAVAKAEIEKPHNLHWFRHSRASLNGLWMTEPVMREYFGWEKDSRQPTNYCHVGEEATKKRVLEFHGIKEEETLVTTVVCACGTSNDGRARHCLNCGQALNMKVFHEDGQKVQEQTDETLKWFFAEVSKHPELLQRLAEMRGKRAT